MSRLRKLLPAPLLSAAIFLLWLLLVREPSLGHALLGLVLALVVPRLTRKLRIGTIRVKRPLTILRYALLVAGDVVLSNLEVGWGVLTWRWKRPRTKFVVIPLDLRDPVGLSVLAMVTTVVPGTVWSELALDRSAYLLHVWNVGDDEAAFVRRFKDRYEKPLREIFE